MLHAFLHADLGTGGVLETTQRERKGWELLVDLREERTRVLALQIILLVELALVDRTPCLSSPAHAVSGSCIHIQMHDVSWSEFPVINPLLWSLLINNNLVAVVQMLLDLVGEDTLQWLNLVLSADTLYGGSDHLVSVLRLDCFGCSLESLPGGHEHVGLWTLGLAADHETVGAGGWEPVYVCAEINLN